MEELKLTLEPEATPTLTLEPDAVEEEPQVEPVAVEETPLTPEERQMIEDFAAKIDITNSQQVLTYGSAAQKKISEFSDSALAKVRTKDLGEVGGDLSKLVGELRGITEPEKGFLGFVKKPVASIQAMKNRYTTAEKNVDGITAVLEGHQVQLMKDISMMDRMYEKNLAYFKELTMYILAGKKKLEYVRSHDLAEARAKAERTGLPEDAQAARDLEDLCIRFEKKLYDLELTRTISIQMGPQIRLIQNNDTLMAEKIQSTIVNTIPLWKNQMVLSLGMEHSRQAMEAQRAVTNMTNELLKKNGEALKQGTIAVAKESERGIVDIETVQKTNRSLIETLDELNKIQTEGRAKRAAAEVELGRIEGELKQKMLELRGK